VVWPVAASAASEPVPSFAGSDVDGVNECHRSSQAYPRILQTELNLGPTAFVACSGATTANVTGGQWNESAQTDALGSETEDVTLIVGGNVVGFSSYILGCVVVCGLGTPIYDTMMAGINQPAFRANLVYLYEQILSKAPSADLYAGDYPYLATPTTTACWGLDFSGAYSVQTALNGIIKDAVETAKSSNPRIHLVKTNYPESPFEGGELCDGSSVLFSWDWCRLRTWNIRFILRLTVRARTHLFSRTR
jgi:hypothetical protein